MHKQELGVLSNETTFAQINKNVEELKTSTLEDLENFEGNKISEEESRNELLNSIFKLKDSEDPNDHALYEQIMKTFEEKVSRFDKQLKSLSRGARRKIKGYSSFSDRYKKGIGLK